MIPFVGDTFKKSWIVDLHRHQIGRIFQRFRLPIRSDGSYHLYPGERWAFDNGAYSDWTNDREFDGNQFRSCVDRVVRMNHRPYLCVCPDKPGDPKSLEYSFFWIRQLPSSLPWYLAVQDGMTSRDVDSALDSGWFRGLFVGGSDRFKHRAHEWVMLAHTHGLPCHFGRASTPKKIRAAHRIGCDSFDTSFPLWTQERFCEFLQLCGAGYWEKQERFAW